MSTKASRERRCYWPTCDTQVSFGPFIIDEVLQRTKVEIVQRVKNPIVERVKIQDIKLASMLRLLAAGGRGNLGITGGQLSGLILGHL